MLRRSVSVGVTPQEGKDMNFRRAILSFAALCCFAPCALLLANAAKADDVYASIRGT